MKTKVLISRIIANCWFSDAVAHFICFQYGRGLRNFHAEQPHQHAVYFTSVLMSELLWTQEELLDALDG